MEQRETYNSSDRTSMPHPGFGGWSSRCEIRIRLVLIEMHPTRAPWLKGEQSYGPKRVFVRMELSSSLQVDLVALIETQ